MGYDKLRKIEENKMKEVIDIGKTREVMPADFAFLSQADKQVVSAVEKSLRTMFGWDEGQPIVISGLEYDSGTKTISEGYLIKDGVVYKVEEKQLVSSTILNTQLKITASAVVMLTKKVISPSPVYDENLVQSVNVHYEHYAFINQIQNNNADLSSGQTSGGLSADISVVQQYLGANAYYYNNLYRVEKVSEQTNSLQEEVTSMKASITEMKESIFWLQESVRLINQAMQS